MTAPPPQLPTAAEQSQAREALTRLRQGQLGLRLADLPGPVQTLVQGILSELAQGHAVQVLPVQAELGTQQAAELLGVSRPHLVKLLDGGEVPHRKVGTHRRVRLEAVLALRERRDQQRQQVMQDLADLDQELGLL